MDTWFVFWLIMGMAVIPTGVSLYALYWAWDNSLQLRHIKREVHQLLVESHKGELSSTESDQSALNG